MRRRRRRPGRRRRHAGAGGSRAGSYTGAYLARASRGAQLATATYAVRPPGRSSVLRPDRDAVDLAERAGERGDVALGLALGYLGLIAVRVNSLPPWLVVAIGVLMTARSFHESRREGDETR